MSIFEDTFSCRDIHFVQKKKLFSFVPGYGKFTGNFTATCVDFT